MPRFLRKPARYGSATVGAMTVRGQSILLDFIPVAHDQRRMAGRAEGGVAGLMVHIAGVDMVQAGLQRDVARARTSVAGGVAGTSGIL